MGPHCKRLRRRARVAPAKESRCGRITDLRYDHNGRLAQVTDEAANTRTRYVYDLAGRVVSARTYTGTAATSNTLRSAVSYEYINGTNRVGGVTTKSELGENTLEVTYGDLTEGKSSAYVYSEFWNNEQTRRYTYDPLGRLQKSTTQTELLALDTQYTYRSYASSGARTTMQVSSLSTAAGTYGYTYDANGNILSVSDGTYTTTYVYNAQNMLVRENNQKAGKTYAYAYQTGPGGAVKSGNIVSRKTYDYTTGTLGTPTQTDTFTYGSSAWGDLLTGYNNKGITYDGALPCIYGSYTIDWDRAGLMSEYSSGSDVHTYTYDVSGNRLTKTDNGVTTAFIYADGMLLGQKTGNNKLTFLFDSAGEYYGFDYNGDKYFYVKNLQGDVIALADISGGIIARYYYDAWGRVLSITGSNTTIANINPIRYRSYYYDAETGFFFLQSRYYDPEICRFLSPDDQISSTVLGDMSVFAYCGNNPIVYIDTTGNGRTYVIYYNNPGSDFYDQAMNSPYYNNKNVYMLSVISSQDFVDAWNSMNGQIDYVYLYLHGGEGKLYFKGESFAFSGDLCFRDIEFRKVNKRTVLFSCEGGAGKESSNVALELSKKTDSIVFACTGGVSYTKVCGKYYARKAFDLGLFHQYYYRRHIYYYGSHGVTFNMYCFD